MEFLNLFVLPIFILFAILMIHQDLKERKVSNVLTFLFFILGFIYFIFSMQELVWFDYILLFIFVMMSYYIYKKGTWGAADGKIFIAVILFLMGFGASEFSLKFLLNLFIFYLLTMLFLITFVTEKKDKKKAFKEVDIIESSLIIVLIFALVRILFGLFQIPTDSYYALIIFFIVILVLIDIVKKILNKYLKKLDHDLKAGIFFIVFELLALYSGGFAFIILFIFVLLFKTSIQIMSALAENVGPKNKSKYESPFSIYLFFGAIYTLLANYSIMELIFMFFL